jgi:hypothetical protein
MFTNCLGGARGKKVFAPVKSVFRILENKKYGAQLGGGIQNNATSV